MNSLSKAPWKLNRLFISIFLIIVILLVTYQVFFIVNQYPDILNKPKEWWNHAYPPRLNRLGNDVVLKNVTSLKKIQYDFPYSSFRGEFIETSEERELRESRRESIKQGFLHAWNGYVKYAWGADEILPISNKPRNSYNGWGASIVDALDTMWIMDLKEEFKNATEHISHINFNSSVIPISIFETTIRYLGGMLSAYELSGDEILLEKAKQLGEAMIPCFNSPTGLPYNNWNLTRGLIDSTYKPYSTGILAQVGTLHLEYMKLAQLTGNSTFFYKVQNVTDVLDKAVKKIPGLYPTFISQESGRFLNYDVVSFGANADSFYEYLIKQYLFVGGAIDQYRRMYEESIDSMHEYLIKEGQVKNRPDLLFLGEIYHGFLPRMEHLGCFVPGMLAIGSKTLNRPKDLEVAIKLGETCYWAYNSTPTGIGPEDFYFLQKNVTVDEKTRWMQKNQKDTVLPDGVYKLNGNYLLRPETIESLFILYRVTGDKSYQEKGWKIWKAIEKWCKTESAYSGLYNVASNKEIVQNNNMESFFLAETLKYLYLLFSTPDVISLDDYVFNTEAHPLLRMKP
ncbi:Glycoside Hydrolase Family 47 protein [Rhizophagus diaphanus]|nr:Glycoside Hydrolase Family 47 protein [Rhizophagus diaphanus] [Rhizophagus sp. MUCL 43196]